MTSKLAFGEKTEAAEVVSTFPDSIKGKIILITGVGPNGLGAALAQSLASQDPALLILTGRTPSKVHTITKSIVKEYPNVATRVLGMDVSSFDSVRRAAKEVIAYKEQHIDILINNAGVMNIPEHQDSTDGFEMHLATNYLGAYLFTTSIMEKLAASGKGRIVNVGSNGYVFSPFRFADYNFEGRTLPDSEQPPKELCEQYGLPWSLHYTPTIAYGQSKTAIMLFTVQLARLYKDKGVTAVCVHPGAIATDLWRQMPKENAEQLFTMMPMKTMSQGTSTTLVAALDPKLKGKKGPNFIRFPTNIGQDSSGVYLADCQLSSVLDFAKDDTYAEKLWKLSEALTAKRVEMDI